MATAFDLDKFAAAEPLVRVRAIERGIPASAVRRFAHETRLPYPLLAGVIGSRRTLDRRIKSDERLTVAESDRFARLVTMYRTLVRMFDNADLAVEWLIKPKQRLDNATPIELMRSGAGAQAVETLILQARHGMLA